MKRFASLLALVPVLLLFPSGPPAGAATDPVVATASTPDGSAQWTVTAHGLVRAHGAATAHGDMAGRPLQRPIVGIAATPAGAGYWLVASDGGIFSFGDARFHGSTGNVRLNQPIVGMTTTPSGGGYWMVARDGGIFSFGDARFHGSTGNVRLNEPIVGMAATTTGNGYWLAARDGGIFSFGDAGFKGSGLASTAGVARLATGYALAATDGRVAAFDGSAPAPSAGARNAFLWPFSSDSPWNRPIGSGARYAGAGDPRVADVRDPARTPWVNAGEWSHPVVQARASDPTVTLSSPQGSVQLKMPSGMQPASGRDAHLHVADPTGRWLDETWGTHTALAGYRAKYHIRTDLHGPGVGQRGVRAYGGSALGGLLRTHELRAGHIPHVVAVALANDQLGRGPVWPATNEDGDARYAYKGTVPMGTLLAIPPSVDVTRLGLTRDGVALARALQDFGGYVVDRAAGLTFYAEPGAEGSTELANLRRDMKKLRGVLTVVVNNAPATPGGGGVPRAPMAPPIG